MPTSSDHIMSSEIAIPNTGSKRSGLLVNGDLCPCAQDYDGFDLNSSREMCTHSHGDQVSLYSSSDPLMHVDLSRMLMTSSSSLENREDVLKNAKSATVSRSLSEIDFCEILERKTSDLDVVMLDSDCVSRGISKSMTLPLTNVNLEVTPMWLGLKKSVKESADVFSDSESVADDAKKLKSCSEKKSKYVHKSSLLATEGTPTSVIGSHQQDCSDGSKVTVALAASDEAAAVTSYLPQPQKGQSILQYLSSIECPTGGSLYRENVQFVMCEAVIAALELIRWKQEHDSKESPTNNDVANDKHVANDKETTAQSKHIHISKRIKKIKKFFRTQRGFTDNADVLKSDVDVLKSNADLLKSDAPECDDTKLVPKTNNSRENIGVSLLKKFPEKDMPMVSDLPWLIPEQCTSSTMCTMGNMEWAPPQLQIIVSIHPSPKRKSLLAKQNYRCAGCGMKVEPDYAKRFRYCHYIGMYFCHCCQSSQTSVIPAKILNKWDFTKYNVSNFAFDFLRKTCNKPLFNILDVNSSLYKKVKALEHFKDWRTQLHNMRSLLNMCKHATCVLEQVQKLPQHFLANVHMYSIDDLCSVHLGASDQMYTHLNNLVTEAISHVDSCEHCHCFGFICEMCHNQKDVIFPFEITKVTVCSNCKSCYHKECFVPQKCPKCARIEVRKKQLEEDLVEDV